MKCEPKWEGVRWNEPLAEMPTFKIYTLIGLMDGILCRDDHISDEGRSFLTKSLTDLHGELNWRIKNGVE